MADFREYTSKELDTMARSDMAVANGHPRRCCATIGCPKVANYKGWSIFIAPNGVGSLNVHLACRDGHGYGIMIAL